MIGELGEVRRAKVTTVSPPRVTMPLAATSQPAQNLWGGTLSAEQQVLVVIMDDGTTYILGPRPETTAPVPGAQEVYLRSPNGTLFKLTVSNAGTLGATPA